ncbi:VanZ family protein [Neptunomonas antarctica]|uniref:VanZ like family protein n=1 Tax=Neptunomonas antarctica TaxID=619304 RepID=A0A1N7IRS9_9GAMM|nr:VanZ family protein [Neptunomonas antarctica]SIS39727.1 VanZ like family protein [Neptunomonas antarctica]
MTTIFSLLKTYWLAITLFVLTVITLLSLWPADQLPGVPGTDKTHHFIAYAGLMFPVALRQPKYWLLIGLFFLCWSGAIELIQPYVNRYGEWLDMVANASGVVSGALLALLINRIFTLNISTE